MTSPSQDPMSKRQRPKGQKRPLPWRDTPVVYGGISRALHWSIALLLLWQFVGMGLRAMLGRESIAAYFVPSHQPVGTALFVLILVRAIWALSNRTNRPDHGAGLVGLAAKLGHALLYLLMLVIPSVALIRAYGSERSFAPFGFEIFSAKLPEIAWTQSLGDALHGELAWVLGVLILGHIIMVGVHEGMWRDGTARKMAGPNRDQV